MNKDKQSKAQKNILEVVVFWMSLLITLALIGYLGYNTFISRSAPPDLKVYYQKVDSKGEHFIYNVVVENKGGETAENVMVELQIIENNQVLEKAVLTFHYVPVDSKKKGWVVFSVDPSRAEKILSRVVSYQKP